MEAKEPNETPAQDKRAEGPAGKTDSGKRGRPTGALAGGPTGVAASDLEWLASERLVTELESKGREARIQEVRIPASESATIVLHALLTLAGSLLGITWPAIGAAICLVAAFSFYAERALGLRLIGRVLPGRKTANVLSPPPGPAWEDVDVVISTGYDVPDSYPVGEWLARRFSGSVTTDRILLYGGMIGSFAAVMLRAVGIEGAALNVFQTVTAAIPLAVIAAQVDRRLAGTPIATQEDLAPARDVMTAAAEADGEARGDSGVGICLFGAEYASAGGAGAFFSDSRLKLKEGCALINLVRGARNASPEVTAREGDLAMSRMSPELAAESPLRPKPVVLRSQTAAGMARRVGLRATTVVGRGEAGIDVLLDTLEGALPDSEDES